MRRVRFENSCLAVTLISLSRNHFGLHNVGRSFSNFPVVRPSLSLRAAPRKLRFLAKKVLAELRVTESYR